MKIWKYLISNRFNSVIIRYFLIIAVLTAIPLITISSIIFNSLNNAANEEILMMSRDSILSSGNFIDNIISEAELILVQMTANDNVIKFVKYKQDNRLPAYRDVMNSESIRNTADIIRLTSKYVDRIMIYSVLNDYIFQTGYGGSEREYYYDKSIFDLYKRISRKSEIHIRTAYISWNKAEAQFLTSITKLPIDDDNNMGFVAIDINTEKIEELLINNDDETFYIFSSSGNCIYSTNQNEISLHYSEISALDHEIFSGMQISYVNDENRTVSFAKSNSVKDWTYVSVTPFKTYQEKTKDLQILVIVLIISSAVLSIGIAFWVSVYMFRPIKQIIDLIETHGDDQHFDYDGTKLSEYKYIARGIYLHYVNEKKLQDEIKDKQYKINKANAIALQAQINPHFLFNTLETINWMMVKEIGIKSQASKMLVTLSALIRLSFSTKNSSVCLYEEIEHSKKYSEILQIRYKNKFSIVWDIDESIENALVPKIILQPLIENAVYHGLKPLKSAGIIKISGHKLLDDQLLIEVSDNGVGADEIYLKSILNNDDNLKEDWQIGLNNVNQRIKLICGTQYGIKISSQLNVGTTVSITLPYILQSPSLD